MQEEAGSYPEATDAMHAGGWVTPRSRGELEAGCTQTTTTLISGGLVDVKKKLQHWKPSWGLPRDCNTISEAETHQDTVSMGCRAYPGSSLRVWKLGANQKHGQRETMRSLQSKVSRLAGQRACVGMAKPPKERSAGWRSRPKGVFTDIVRQHRSAPSTA